MTYEAALAELARLPSFERQAARGLKRGLERIAALLEALGHPERAYPVIHVGGTNGKGSTCAFLAAIWQAAGYRVGLHTSPHLLELGERMRVNGKPASREWIADFVGRARPWIARIEPSYFEFTVAMSLAYFAHQEVDLAVVEVGLGGRWDATNVLLPELAIVTNVGTDHAEILGPTPVEIAREKAGIFKPGRPALTAARHKEARCVLEQVAREVGCSLEYVPGRVRWERLRLSWEALSGDLYTPAGSYPELELGLLGLHQLENAALAVRAAERLSERFSRLNPEAIRTGLARVRQLSGLRARMERLLERPRLILDVAHNPEGVRALLQTIRRLPVVGRRWLLFGVLADKDYARMVPALAAWADAVIVTEPPSKRALAAERLREAFEALGRPTACHKTVQEAWAALRDQAESEDLILACGSTYLVAELLCLFGERADPRL
ncbi:MAG: bifunctional folylpolyglutamate synthase/dihydrofolate synthase [Bacteroidetes bacterium]|nr:bifunctional folylpolyglutamate synthase/dihydrofolate synthase [Rhodothermia bacterium]MCS7155398.1 bifunctional folylpolyglutamate synthase/dihydrofolate synthase [Bacteroidota bacterium]MCX7907509.1 bifunctional folylpolyglutamate synthase/dihydrofolate synthase [Bacteroidota bacterium]MDW8138503.1 folylpolyglutamate synthase/dihydrofolate synthase family protein [Bacteroidota bacterium]MDW8284560.1 folylpolyglutamate synthase/dihydrofolate synthase family protein [Bacteroidota bacterium]